MRSCVFSAIPSAGRHGVVRTKAMIRARSSSRRCRNISDGMNNTLLPSRLTPLRSTRRQLRITVFRKLRADVRCHETRPACGMSSTTVPAKLSPWQCMHPASCANRRPSAISASFVGMTSAAFVDHGVVAIELALGREIEVRKPDQRESHETGNDKSQPLQNLLHDIPLTQAVDNSRHGTQHLVVHRFARKRDEKGMR